MKVKRPTLCGDAEQYPGLLKILQNDHRISARKLGRQFNLNPAAIVKLRKKLGFPRDPQWNVEKVINDIQEHQKQGRSLRAGYVHTKYKALYRAAYRLFGSWGAAVSAAGFNYNEVNPIEYWDKNKIISKINDLKLAGASLSSLDIQKENGALFMAAITHIGSWRTAVELAGHDYSKIRKTNEARSYSKEDIVRQINDWKINGELINAQNVQQKYPAFEAQARRKFGSWQKVIEAAGLNYDDVLLSVANEIRRGLIFEKIVHKYFQLTKPFYDYHKRIKIGYRQWLIPDFLDTKNNIWVDCKVRCWSLGVKFTIEKYLPYAAEVHFYYLYGTAPKDTANIKYFNILKEPNIGDYPDMEMKLLGLKSEALSEDEAERIDRTAAESNLKIRRLYNKYDIKEITIEEIKERVKNYYAQLGHFPRKNDIALGDNLWYSMKKFGGARKISILFEIPEKKRNRRFAWDTLEAELRAICQVLGRFPTKGDLKQIGKLKLKPHIRRFGGAYVVASKLGYPIKRTQPNTWRELNRLRVELIPICNQLGRMSTITELKQSGRTDLISAISRHGGIYRVSERIGVNPVRDKDEERNWRTVVKDIEKLEKGLGHFPSIADVKESKLKGLLSLIQTHFGGLHRVAERMGRNLAKKPPRYWTRERVVAELARLNNDFGRLPTRKDLAKIARLDLIDPIKLHGGIHKLAEAMNLTYSGPKPKGYFKNINNLIRELRPICEKLNRFPTRTELITNNQKNLVPIISREGGSRKIKELMGY